jgi:hypothetical protein
VKLPHHFPLPLYLTHKYHFASSSPFATCQHPYLTRSPTHLRDSHHASLPRSQLFKGPDPEQDLLRLPLHPYFHCNLPLRAPRLHKYRCRYREFILGYDIAEWDCWTATCSRAHRLFWYVFALTHILRVRVSKNVGVKVITVSQASAHPSHRTAQRPATTRHRRLWNAFQATHHPVYPAYQ